MTRQSLLFLTMLSACILAACTTTPEQQAALNQEALRLEAEIAKRQGESVNRICPLGSADWKPFGSDALLIEAKGDWYKIDLIGTCDPDSAFGAIANKGSIGSSCIERGDTILTALPRDHERCTITAIHQWDDTAADDEDGG
ncbi:MAG: DUF6491 family protein [Pseudomonadota bacterium]